MRSVALNQCPGLAHVSITRHIHHNNSSLIPCNISIADFGSRFTVPKERDTRSNTNKNTLCDKLNVFFLIRVYQWLCSVPQHDYAMVDQGARVWLPRFSFLPLSTTESRSWDCRCRSAWVNKVKTKNDTKASPGHRSVSRVCLFSPPLHCDLSPAKSHKRPWNDKSYR